MAGENPASTPPRRAPDATPSGTGLPASSAAVPEFSAWKQKPRPRVLVHGEVPGAERLSNLFPTVDLKPQADPTVNLQAYDVIVTVGPALPVIPQGVFVLAVGALRLETIQWSSRGRLLSGEVCFDHEVPLGDGVIPNTLDPRVRDLVNTDLLPVVAKSGVAREWGINQGGVVKLKPVLTPFALTSSGQAIAGAWPRPGGAVGWALPSGIDVVRWARAAAAVWRVAAPDRFPEWVPWEKDRDWFTADQLRVAQEADALEVRAAAVAAELEAERTGIAQRVDAAGRAAAAGERRLLVAQGDGLKTAVHAALINLGFTVEDQDAKRPLGDRLEDLRVGDPTVPGWVAIVEVRGQARGGAKSAELLRVSRHAMRFAAETGRAPDSRWYVVNQMAERSPAERPDAFATQPEDLQEFAADGGLVIDTRDLFRAVRDAQLGHAEMLDLRGRLRETRGLFRYPVSP